MLSIAFINPNMLDKYPRPPLGLLSLATVCKEQGYKVEIIDANLHNYSLENIHAKASNFDVVAITAMSPSIHLAYQIADRLSDKTIILGGVHASVFPYECARTGYFDAVIVGEG